MTSQVNRFTIEFHTDATKLDSTDCNLCLDSIILTDKVLLGPKTSQKYGCVCVQCEKRTCYLCLMKTRDASCPFCRHSVAKDVDMTTDWLDFRQEEWNERVSKEDELDIFEARHRIFRQTCQRLLAHRQKALNRLTLQKQLCQERLDRVQSRYDLLAKRHNKCSKSRYSLTRR